MTHPAPARPASVLRTPVERALDRACGARAIPGNRVTHLCDGPETYAAMHRLIAAATSRIYFENYIIRDDATGRAFAERLADAAARGVAVYVLYDHFGCRGTSRRYWKRLRQAGITVRVFNRVNLLRPIDSLRRDHSKYAAADGKRAIVGGLCIGDEWAGRPERRVPPWRDSAVEVCGPAVPALDATFARKWEEAGGSFAHPPGGSAPEPCGDAVIRIIDGIPGKLRLFRTVQLLVAGAADRVWVTDAYLVAPSPLYAGLLAAARDGVDVRLLLPGRTDIPAVRALTRVGYRELLESGVRIWEWRGPMLHAKTVVADDVWFKVGSSNLNPSSLLSNHELDLLIQDRGTAATAAQQFRRDLPTAVEIVLRARRGFERLAAHLPPAVVPESGHPPLHPRGPATRRELSQRAAVTLAQVAGGARRSVAGALVFSALGAAALFLALPRIMAYAVAVVMFWLGAGAAWAFLGRRAYRAD